MTKTRSAPAPGTFNICECSRWRSSDSTMTTGCRGDNTKRVFAPGHDAKLKGLFLKAYRFGLTVMSPDTGEISPGTAATLYGWRSAMVVPAGPSTATATATAATVGVAGHILLRGVKIGRWTYSALVDANGDATYTNKKGTQCVARKGSYTLTSA